MSLRSHQQAVIEEVIAKFTSLMNTENITAILDSQREFNRNLAALCKERFRQLRGQLEETGESGLLTALRTELGFQKDLADTYRTDLENLRQALHDSHQENHMLESKLEAAGAEVALLREDTGKAIKALTIALDEKAALRKELEKVKDRCEALNIVATDANRDRLSVTDERNVLRDKVRSLAGKLAAAEFRLVEVFEERDELKRMLAAMDSPLLKAKPGPTITPKLLEENVKLRNELNSALAEVDELKKSLDEVVERFNNHPNQLQAVRLKTAEVENAKLRKDNESLRRRLLERPSAQGHANLRDKWLNASGRLAKVQAYLVGRRDLYGGQQVDPQCGCDDCVFLAELDSFIALCATDSSAS